MKSAGAILLAVAVLGLLADPPTTAKTIYVDANAPGSNTGTSWANAYRFLQDALADANSSPKPVEIRVAQGIYRPDRSSAESNGTGNKKAFFQLISGVTLKGGYAGFGQPDPNASDIGLYQSVLSGDLLGNDLSQSPQGLELVDNSECVVDGSGTDRTAVLDGFVIARGYRVSAFWRGVPWTAPDRSGGGMRIISGSPTVIRCTFQENRFGASNVVNSMPSFIDCQFVKNFGDSGDYGGAMVNIESHPEITGCVFENNSSSYGGVIYTRDGDITAIGCRFSSNDASAIVSSGGQLRIIACEFSNNVNGAVSITDASVVVVEDCIFSGNKTYGGSGGLHVKAEYVTLSRCRFELNSAGLAGGAVGLSGCGTVIITDCTFEANRAGRHGGAVFSTAENLTFDRCAFVGNRVQEEGGIVFEGAGGTLGLINCTLAGNRADQDHVLLGYSSWVSVKSSIV